MDLRMDWPVYPGHAANAHTSDSPNTADAHFTSVDAAAFGAGRGAAARPAVLGARNLQRQQFGLLCLVPLLATVRLPDTNAAFVDGCLTSV